MKNQEIQIDNIQEVDSKNDDVFRQQTFGSPEIQMIVDSL